MKKKTSSPKTAESGKLKKALSCWQLYILLIPALIWLIVFAYYPMYGLIIAFKDFKGRIGIMGSPWADPIFKYFKMFFSTSIAMTAIKNTIIISLESLIIGFPIPVIFALLLNQVQRSGPRRIIQTISYAPYFMSNVVVVSLISVLFSANGLVNHAVMGAGGKAIMFTSLPEYFIIFIAALTAISPEYYEAATMDGASRFQKILYIDLPLIMPTIILMLILQVGNIMNVGYEKAYLMQNGTNTTVSEIISTYVYKVGLQTAQYSFATAVGLFNSVVNFIILVITNAVAKKTSDISIF